jgi:hypothetical protein
MTGVQLAEALAAKVKPLKLGIFEVVVLEQDIIEAMLDLVKYVADSPETERRTLEVDALLDRLEELARAVPGSRVELLNG